ncbi:MAG: DNA alkylation repair protein [Gammaproteobacteria bacterium]|nr:DNA alkylation repair protein [Gammaproteobacteria bacterium]
MSTSVSSRAVRQHLLRGLRAVADPDRALQQQVYMKSTMPYLGVTTPVQRKIARAVFQARAMPDAATWRNVVLDIWRHAKFREERYCAMELAGFRAYRDWLNPQAMPMLEELIVTGAWWDYVDAIASNMVGAILKNNRSELTPLLAGWATDDDMWRRRTAILAQLKFKAETDEQLLFHAIEASMASPEFFLRKAIGWALREYSKTRPEVVIGYVHRHRNELSGLSKREGLKVMLKQGRVSEIPAEDSAAGPDELYSDT